MPHRLVLGTAQLGMPYGINNRQGKPPSAQAREIIKAAYEAGIREFDTAQAYGDSEEVLGNTLSSLGINDQVKIISKFHPSINHNDQSALQASIAQSLARLKVKQLEALLLHDERLLDLWDKGLYSSLEKCMAVGQVRVLGVSVYHPSRALQAIKTDGIMYIQIPSSIIDQRFEREGVFQKASQAGKMVYVRSVFLQGLLLMPIDDIPSSLNAVKETMAVLNNLAKSWKMSMAGVALGYALTKWPNAKIIFGAESKSQVDSNIQAAAAMLSSEQIKDIDHLVPDFNEHILNPALWEK